MNSGRMLKVLSVLLILVCVFGIVAGIFGFITTVNMKKAKKAESALFQTQISQLEEKTAALNAKKSEFDSDTASLKQNKAAYESDKAAYDMLKTAYDAKATEFKAEKAAGHMDSSSLSETQSILDEGAAKLEAGKAKLSTYEAAQTFVDNYKAEQAAVNADLTKLSQNESVAAMNNSGLTPLFALKEAFKEEAVKTSRQISAGIYLCAVSMIIAVLALFASFKGIAAVRQNSFVSIKDAIFLGLTSLILAIAANVFGIMNGYPGSKLLSSALAGEALFALLFVITVIRFRKAVYKNDKGF